MSQSDSVFLGQTDSFILKMSQSDSTYIGQNWDNMTQFFCHFDSEKFSVYQSVFDLLKHFATVLCLKHTHLIKGFPLFCTCITVDLPSRTEIYEYGICKCFYRVLLPEYNEISCNFAKTLVRPLSSKVKTYAIDFSCIVLMYSILNTSKNV